MKIIETPVFTRQVLRLMDDDSYRELQSTLIANPELGTIIKGSGGIRKIRWSGSGRGKRGGTRVIYFVVYTAEALYMLFAYPKNELDNISASQLKKLRLAIEKEVKNGRQTF